MTRNTNTFIIPRSTSRPRVGEKSDGVKGTTPRGFVQSSFTQIILKYVSKDQAWPWDPRLGSINVRQRYGHVYVHMVDYLRWTYFLVRIGAPSSQPTNGVEGPELSSHVKRRLPRAAHLNVTGVNEGSLFDKNLQAMNVIEARRPMDRSPPVKGVLCKVAV